MCGAGNRLLEWEFLLRELGAVKMQTAIERVMQTYSMMVKLTGTQHKEAREKVISFLKERVGDEHQLAVEGLKYLLGHEPKQRRRPAHLSTVSSSCCGS